MYILHMVLTVLKGLQDILMHFLPWQNFNLGIVYVGVNQVFMLVLIK